MKRLRKVRYCTYLAEYRLVPKSKVLLAVMLLDVCYAVIFSEESTDFSMTFTCTAFVYYMRCNLGTVVPQAHATFLNTLHFCIAKATNQSKYIS